MKLGEALTLGWLVISAPLVSASSQLTPEYQLLPSLREQAKIVNEWVDQRKRAIPALLKKHDVDAWLISQREYVEDTVFWSLKDAEELSARRRTTFLFLANPPADHEAGYKWSGAAPELWDDITRILEDRNVQSIAINADPTHSFSSGLTYGEHQVLTSSLGTAWASKLVVKPLLAIEFIATQSNARLPWYHKLQETAWACISEALSSAVITPDVTTTDDVQWWMWEKLQSLNYTTWFQPSVMVPNRVDSDSPPDPSMSTPITYGDLVHIDFGVSAMGMNTDTQHLGYVLRPGETEKDVPESLREGMRKGNRLQDILKENMIPGKTGEEILEDARKQMHGEGLEGRFYSHPTGDWGHSAGTAIGFWEKQKSIGPSGEIPLLSQTWYSIELWAEHWVPEHNKTIRFMLEEDVYWSEQSQTFEWIYQRQEKLHLIHTAVKDTDQVPLEL